MLNQSIRVGVRLIDSNSSPYIVAEAGSNFNQKLDVAKRLIEVASESGASAVKFQLFRADSLYPNRDQLYSVFKELELNPDWVEPLSTHASEYGVEFLASAFDYDSVDILEDISISAHKIASSETTNLKLLHYVASKRKPVLVSTGMCDLVDVQEAINVCLAVGNSDIVLMQCGSMYPLPVQHVHLRTISTFNEMFGGPVGFSDHTLGRHAAVAAVGVGATVFEKHFTLDKEADGPDHFYALEPDQLKMYVRAIQDAYESLGSPVKQMLPDEITQGRREGLYAAHTLEPGAVLEVENLLVKRPALGLRARYQSVAIGAKITKTIEAGDPIGWEHLEFH
jgi:sialic acid synthase SpsE